ncbi:MAG: Bug family tripartite tricarboxylate transporter substrate binding protein [Burkholderiales bacterium]
MIPTPVRRLRFLALLSAAGACLAAGAAQAQTFPTKPVRFVVPFAPGGANDIIARVMAQRLAEPLGQQVIVDNRGGAGGALGAEMVVRAAPDGYTLLLANPGPNAINPSLTAKPLYDPLKDFSFITLMAVSPMVLVVNPTLPAKNVQEFITLARAKPGLINYGSSGTGAITHLSMEYFRVRTKTDLTHIPYQGANPALTALIGNQVAASFVALGSYTPLMQTGKLRALGIAARERNAQLPDVPTINESGVPNFEVTNWFGIVGPAKLPKPVVERFNSEIARILKSQDMQDRFVQLGFVSRGGAPAEFEQFVKAEIARWREVIKAQGIKGE